VAPLDGEYPVHRDKWTPLTDGEAFEYTPVFSPDGNRVYYFSDRDGSFCIRSQRLDPLTKKPLGLPEVLYHVHDADRRMDIATAGLWTMSVAVDKIVLPLRMRSGNIWLAEPAPAR
jgi:hypothetical protein